MRYSGIERATFLRRPNRFLAEVELAGDSVAGVVGAAGKMNKLGDIELVHVKNTGRCKELLIPGRTVYVEKSKNPNRKTGYSLIAVDKDGLLINMDSQAPNQVACEALEAGVLLDGMTARAMCLRREVTFGDSRMDLAFTMEGQSALVEVKGVTLEEGGIVMFPDAPTLRGLRHVETLIQAKKQGFHAYLLFIVQLKRARVFRPNWATQPELGEALRRAVQCGVIVSAYDCTVTPDTIRLGDPVPVDLERPE